MVDGFGARSTAENRKGRILIDTQVVDPIGKTVYPDHGQLWLTARLLITKSEFQMPDDARELIEGVYGEEAEIPEGLAEKKR